MVSVLLPAAVAGGVAIDGGLIGLAGDGAVVCACAASAPRARVVPSSSERIGVGAVNGTAGAVDLESECSKIMRLSLKLKGLPLHRRTPVPASTLAGCFPAHRM